MSNFKDMLSTLNIPQKVFSKEIGITYGSFRTMTTKNKLKMHIPSWMKAFALGVRVGQMSDRYIDVTKYEGE
jgi:hypothetical protein